ncbi:penicillin-binding transpeptidase domain-containing protein [Bacillus sp. FJAT-49736]|uniref:penicillin-binding transpeptidase domain-containing protein n=1 Tax=Bacillus sp. FJAT-49736 TaxID=2833582 RepID=UPI001BCA1CBF|nr:penicillin-binding transpeptidase domain-containing protein [Bacillus sp. FJAT-49736]MBS4174331.1 penicillin-binding transpeptidase domain-containing protein [Bacillus sp. FJAT-49736]
MKKISVFVVVFLVAIGLLSACQKEASPNDRLKDYVKLWDKGNFNKMYNDFLSSSSKKEYKTADFVDRYPKIYKDLEVKNIKITYSKLKEDAYKKKDKVSIPVNISFDTFAGPVQYTEKVSLKKEERDKNTTWYIDWKPSLILPGLAKGDKIVPETIEPKRGEIRDRNGQGLAVNGTAYQIGVIPEKMATKEPEIKEQLSKLLGLTVKEIDQKLNASWVKPNLFVPIKKISTNNEGLLAKLYDLPGVDKQDTTARVYPFGKAAAHLVGYIGPISAEELKEEQGKGYDANSVIGKRGLEQLYEDRLRGTAGTSISILKEDGTKKVVAQREVKDGDNIAVTIDANLQEKIYNQLKGSAGTAAAIQPITGEVLSLVSSPSFDPNDFVLGMSGSEYSKLEKDPLQPLINRFALSYAPGSSIKPITAAIALQNGTLKPNSTKNIEGKSWGKGGSWGDYKVSRVHVQNGAVSLSDAMMYSDNIFFAQTALDMGGNKFVQGLKNFGFTEQLPFDYPLKKSQVSSDGKLDREILLADSGYGQGQVQMNILHLADTYTTFVNNGNMIKPYLLLNDKNKGIWKENVISPENAKAVAGLLRKVVADPRGTGHGADLPNVTLAGKTGTAELKKSKDEKGKENGLFVAYDQNKKNLLVAVMIEGVEKGGGSHLVVSKVANIFK